MNTIPATALNRRSFLSRTALAAGAFSLAARAGAKDHSAPPPGPSPYICVTCGTQFARTEHSPDNCPVCLDERQYVGAGGQRWTTLNAMRQQDWRNVLQTLEPNLVAIWTEPKFGIGQRALLVRTAQGNILWDCVSYLDDATVRAVRSLGGISAIAISHPHYYSAMVEWSRAFDSAPIHLHEADRKWVMRPDANIRFWKGEKQSLGGGLTLIRTGGHFDGFQVMHWQEGAEGRGALLSGDQPQVVADPHWVSFMYSYPNYIPLNAPAIRRIVDALDPFDYDRIYSAFRPGVVKANARSVVRRSAERYLKHVAA